MKKQLNELPRVVDGCGRRFTGRSTAISAKLRAVGRFLPLFCFVVVSSLFIQGCDEPGEEEPGPGLQLKKLSKTWKLKSVKLDEVSQTGYESFTLTFSGSSADGEFDYATTGRPSASPSPWPDKGKCTFDKTTPETKMTRDPSGDAAVPMTYSVDSEQLRVSFVFSGEGYEGGFVLNVRGNWVFEFN